MSKKDKKIEIQISDAKISVNNVAVDGYRLNVGKKIIGEIVELEDKFAILKNGDIDTFFKTMEQAVQAIVENYNLNH